MSLVLPSIYAAVTDALQSRRPAALCTVVAVEGSVPGKLGAKMLVFGDGTQLGTIGGAGLEQQVRARALEAIANSRSGTHRFILAKWVPEGLNSICGGIVEIYVEALTPPPHLLLCGGGHVAQALAQFCPALEISYSVLDGRPDYTTEALFPHAGQRIIGSTDGLDLTPFSDIYLLGYSWEVDTDLLADILPRFSGFVGLIGSQTKVETTARELVDRGVPLAAITNITCPIGLPIGAESPAEIAIAILAELIARTKGVGVAP